MRKRGIREEGSEEEGNKEGRGEQGRKSVVSTYLQQALSLPSTRQIDELLQVFFKVACVAFVLPSQYCICCMLLLQVENLD